MIQKITLLFVLIAFSACASIKEKVNIKGPGKACPPAGERTVKDLLCKEPK